MTPLLLAGLLTTQPAPACGGFFCSGGGYTTQTYTEGFEAPVTQKSERILFHVDERAGMIHTFVEVSYIQNEYVDFAWVIPLPEVIAAEDVSTANADMFNALERATAPRFTFTWTERNFAGYGFGGGGGVFRGGDSGGCKGGCADGAQKETDTAFPSDDDTAEGNAVGTEEVAVEVVDEAVVGPFAIEVITANDAGEFAIWLADNGYDMPDIAIEPLTHYVDMKSAFLGVRLAPDVPEGPIDTLVFSYPGTQPMIPLILTAIATCPDLPIVAYILADEIWGPENWVTAYNPGPDTLPSNGGIDYNNRLEAVLDQHGGHAFVREASLPTDQIELDLPQFEVILRRAEMLTRLRGSVSPAEMNEDPFFIATPGVGWVRPWYEIELDGPPDSYRGDGGSGGAWMFLPLITLVRRRRHGRDRAG